jgi:Ala-tRNA(Pro) deacylase
MTIAPSLRKYLDQNVTYDVICHEPTTTSMRTAEASHVSGECLAKAVVLRRDGGYMLAVLPASHHIRLPDLEMQLGEHVDLAKEGEVDALFQDCAHGAVPPIGVCYEIDVIVDDSIADQPEVYLEGGDHATLIHLSHAQFAQLIVDARRGHFSVHD